MAEHHGRRLPRSGGTAALWLGLMVGPFALLGAGASGVQAQQPVVTDTATPGPEYATNDLTQFLFGSSYRDLWTTPVEAPLLDLAREGGGGLTPTGTGGGRQTLNLRFKGADGLPYTFRVLDKDPTKMLPPELKNTFAQDVLLDQVSSGFPTAPPVVDVLLRAVGIHPRDSRLFIMPDDSLLGQYREAFAGKAGILEVWANERAGGAPGFAGATDVISTDELQSRMMTDVHQRVDVPTYLTARLVDIFIGDWDRHRGQWRWGNIGPGDPPSWVAFPEDRDQAFARYDGILLLLAARSNPELTKFGPKYPQIVAAAWNGRDVDRFLLPRIDKQTWDSVARFVHAAITNEVIEEAVRQLPRSHYELRADFLRTSLRARRQAFLKMAEKYYRQINYQVDLQMTDLPDEAELIRGLDGTLTVHLYALEQGRRAAAPYLSRRFDPRFTSEVRLYPNGGDDRVVIVGPGTSGVLVRVVSDQGHNVVIDSTGGSKTKVYEERPDSLELAGEAQLDTRHYDAPVVPPGKIPPRDWGSQSYPLVWVKFSATLGLLPVVGYEHVRFGFHKRPFAQKHTLLLATSTARQKVRLSYRGTLMQENSHDEVFVRARVSGIELNNFYGFGNNTTSDAGDRDFFMVEQQDFRVGAEFRPQLVDHVRATLGVTARYTTTSTSDSTLLNQVRPYGITDFGQLGPTAGLELDLRDNIAFPRKGIWSQVGTVVYPAVLSAADSGSFGEVHGFLAGYLTPVEPVTYAWRVGGKYVWGNFPFQESAFLGDRNLRGYRQQRFAGDAMFYFNSELRMVAKEVFFLFPNDLGLIGIFDLGRVWYQGQSTGNTHFGYGGGISFAPFKQQNSSVVMTIAGGDDGTVFHLHLGVPF